MIRVEVDAREVLAGLADLKNKATDWRTHFRRGAEAARKIEDRWFETEGRGSWAALAEETVESRGGDGSYRGYYRENLALWKGEGPSHKILHWTHRLRKSVTTKGAKGHVARYEGLRSFRFGSNYEYQGLPIAFWVHFGTKRMPARPILDEAGITRAFKGALEAGIRVRRLGMN